MSTRSLIGMLLPSNHVQYIYCHWDGYLSHNGKLLLNHYNDLIKVSDLIDLSDIKSLEKDIEDIETFEDLIDDTMYLAKSEEDFLNKNHGSDYKYLFKDNQWYYASFKDNKFKKLTEDDIKND